MPGSRRVHSLSGIGTASVALSWNACTSRPNTCLEKYLNECVVISVWTDSMPILLEVKE